MCIPACIGTYILHCFVYYNEQCFLTVFINDFDASLFQKYTSSRLLLSYFFRPQKKLHQENMFIWNCGFRAFSYSCAFIFKTEQVYCIETDFWNLYLHKLEVEEVMCTQCIWFIPWFYLASWTVLVYRIVSCLVKVFSTTLVTLKHL